MKENVELKEIQEPIDKLSQNQLETFKFQSTIKLVLLERGDELWRVIKSRGNIRSSFWLDSKGLEVIFSDFYQRLLADKMLKKVNNKKGILEDVSRNRAAVKQEWQDNFNSIVKVAVRKPLYAYFGIIGPQPDEKIDKLYDGGTYQYVVPRFQHYKDEKSPEKIDEYIAVNDYSRLVESSWYKRFQI